MVGRTGCCVHTSFPLGFWRKTQIPFLILPRLGTRPLVVGESDFRQFGRENGLRRKSKKIWLVFKLYYRFWVSLALLEWLSYNTTLIKTCMVFSYLFFFSVALCVQKYSRRNTSIMNMLTNIILTSIKLLQVLMRA